MAHRVTVRVTGKYFKSNVTALLHASNRRRQNVLSDLRQDPPACNNGFRGSKLLVPALFMNDGGTLDSWYSRHADASRALSAPITGSRCVMRFGDSDWRSNSTARVTRSTKISLVGAIPPLPR